MMKSWISEDCSTKNPKIHLFKQNLWIQVKKMDFWISHGFFGFFWILRKGVWIFGFPSQKPKKTQGKRWIFQKKQKTQGKRWIFAKIQKNLGKRWIFPILISKIQKTKEKDGFLQKIQKTPSKKIDFSNPDIKNPKKLKEKDGFFQKIQKNAGKSWIFAKIHLFPLIFLDF